MHMVLNVLENSLKNMLEKYNTATKRPFQLLCVFCLFTATVKLRLQSSRHCHS